jgi:hypothetical protein
MGGNLKDNTDNVDEATDDDCSATTNEVGAVTSNECTEEGAGGQDGDDERLVRAAECLGIGTFNDVDEDCRASNTVDVARIVTEEDTAKGREGANQVGLPGDRCLDIVDVARGSQRGTRHDRQGIGVVGLGIVGTCQAGDERAPLGEREIVEVRNAIAALGGVCGG